MNHSRRSLALEAIEDRFLPSVTFISFNSGYGDYHSASRFSHQDYSYSQPTYARFTGYDYYGRSNSREEIIVRVDPQFLTFIANLYGSSQGSTPTNLPSSNAIAPAQQDTEVRAETAAKSSSGQSRTTPRTRTDSTQSDDPKSDSVSLSVGSQSVVGARDFRVADRAVEQAQVAQAQVVATGSTQLTSSRMSYPLLEGLDVDAIDGSAKPGAMPSESPEPPKVAPIPEQTPAEEATSAPALPTPAPFAAAFALDVTLLGTATNAFLERVSDLSPEWPSAMPEFEDYFWTATAVLLAGGAVRAATHRRAEQSRQRPAGLDSTLAEWEEKNAGRVG